ncbi:MAG: GAF domain-containing protein [Anaerolineae bacterium]
MMGQSLPPVRRNILLTLLAAVLVLLPLLVLFSSLIVNLAPQAAPQSRLNYLLFAPLFVLVLMGLVYRYLAPVARLGRLLRQDKEPPPEAVRQARQVAFNAPVYLFVSLLGAIVLMTLLSNVAGLLLISDYEFVPHLSESLLIIASATSVALLTALIARRQVQPVLVTTAYLLPSLDTSPPTSASPAGPSAHEHEGRRFNIRIRLLIIILALTFVAYCLPSVLAFNLVYQFHAASEPLIRYTLLLLLGFGLMTMAFTLLSALIVTGDVSGELRRMTWRLLEMARRGKAGGQLPVLSLDEVEDLVRAFNEVQARIQAQQEHQHLLALQSIFSRINAIFDLDRLLDELVQSVRATFGYYNALIFLADEAKEELYLAASDRPLATEMRECRFKIGSEGIVGHVASTGTPLLISDVSEHDFRAASSSEVRSAMVTPMLVGGRLVGVFDVESDQANGFEEQDLQLMTALANQAAAAVEAVRLLQESRANAMALEQRAQNLMLINRISSALTSSLDAYEILDVTVQHLVELSGVDYGGVLILEQDRRYGRIIAEYPIPRFADLRLRLPSLQQRLELGIPYAVEDAANHPLLESLREQGPSLEFCSVLLVPLVARREMIGILLLASLKQARTFSDEEMEICQTVASQAAVAVANARLLQDIQQQKRALVRKSQEMTEESSKLDAIINNIADGLVVTDPAGRIILSNPAFREMAGLPPVRSLGGLLLAGSFPVAGLQSLAAQALEVPGQVFTENLALPDGRVLKTSATALRIPPPILEPEKGQQIAGVVTVLRDITHEVEVDRMKTDFISAVSHELRSPLTAILGFASLIRRDFYRWIAPRMDAGEKTYQVAERIMDNLVIVENESERLTRLINDVLDIAKMEAGEIEWPMARTDLAEVVQDAVAATTALAEEKNLSIQIHLPSHGFPPVWGHRDRLIQVTTNLLSNAVKFTEQGQIEVRGWGLDVQNGTLHTRGPSPPPYHSDSAVQNVLNGVEFSDGEWVVVSITDTGVGIRAEDLPRVFERFTQVGDTLTEKPEGTGLGLAICKEIIEHHGGRIWAESEPGKGSVFSFALPAAPLGVGTLEMVEHPVVGKTAPVAPSYFAGPKVNGREKKASSGETAPS